MEQKPKDNAQIIDVHTHLGPWPRFYLPDVSLQGILKIMDSTGVDKIISAHHAFLAHYFEHGIEESLRAYEESNGRVLSYAVYNPNHPDETMRFVEKCLDEKAFVGIKIHPSFHQCYADDERYRIVWEYADKKKVPILTHSWDYSFENPVQKFSFPSLFEKFLSEFPSVSLILGHAGGRYNGHLSAVELARKHKNVYLDLAGDSYSFGLVEWLVEKAGADRVLYGSDLPWMDPRTHLGRVIGARITDEDKMKILGINASRLFKLDT
jgi:predicted TIM-barrel fold metal-dependent hydrolase